MRLTFLALLVFLFLPPQESYAQKSLWQVITESFSGPEDKGPDPSKTMQAPFAYDPARKIDNQNTLPENAVSLEQPHRTTAEIAQWLMVTVSDVLTFESENFKQEMARETPYFSATGRKQYKNFLKHTGLYKVLESGRYELRGFVQDTPLLLNEGAVKGRYRWLFEVPAVVSHIDRQGFSYAKKDPVNQKLDLKIQVGRIAENDKGIGGKHGIVIDIWKGDLKTLDNR